MRIEIRHQAIDPWAEVTRYEQVLTRERGSYGACAVFVGTMRDFNEGASVRAMTLEHYPGMTENHLEQIGQEAKARWPILDGLIIHRVGEVQPGDTIVVIAVWSAHRSAAFEACRFLIEDLKSRAPFWKKETLAEGDRWVEKNTG